MQQGVFLTQRFDSARALRSVPVRKLFVHCDGDEVVPSRLGQALFRSAAGPKQILLIASGNHNRCPDAERTRWAAAVQEVLSGDLPKRAD